MGVIKGFGAPVDDVALGRLGARLGLLRRLLVGLVEVTLPVDPWLAPFLHTF